MCLLWMFAMQPTQALTEPSQCLHEVLKTDGAFGRALLLVFERWIAFNNLAPSCNHTWLECIGGMWILVSGK